MTTDYNPARAAARKASRARNANGEYQDLHELATERTEDLESAIAEHQRQQNTDPANWGYHGDLEHALMKLDEALAALGDTSALERTERPYGYR